MFIDPSDEATTEAAIDAGVSAYVVDGLKRERIKPVLDLAIQRFKAFARLQAELREARAALAERGTIDRAKAILIQSRGLSEPQAYALLRTTAMQQGRRIVDVASALVTAARSCKARHERAAGGHAQHRLPAAYRLRRAGGRQGARLCRSGGP